MDTYHLIRPALFCTDPEVAHDLAISALKFGLHPRDGTGDRGILSQRLFGLDFANPIGMAAGFDKNAEVADPLLKMGFGSVEVGTVTPRPQPGNPKPRVFRLADDRALINRLGFNSDGHERVKARLEARARADMGIGSGIVGINVGANKDSADPAGDYVLGVRAFSSLADYLTVNISSPNTPGLRDLQARGALRQLLDRVMEELDRGRRPPLLVKIAPDLDDGALAVIIETAIDKNVNGLIVSNTTIERDGLLDKKLAAETGGLSGAPLFAPSTRMLARAHSLARGELVFVGVGGVATGADALLKIKAGASLIQFYTAMVFDGPGIAMRIKQELAALVENEGSSSVSQLVGSDADVLRNFGLRN